MRTIFAIAAAAAGVALVSTAALAAQRGTAPGGQGSYCLKIYNDGEKDCSFMSLAECNATASGLAAECYAVDPQATVGETGALSAQAGDASKRSDRPAEPR
jgi:hypothetical protein